MTGCTPHSAHWETTMIVDGGLAWPKTFVRSLSVVVALILAAPLLSSQERAEKSFVGPTFRKGLWRFVRTLEIVKPQNVKQKLLEREMTRCVDPTHAMKATFSANSIGTCHSSRPEKVNNKYIFSNRCDYMGPVSTVITVQSDEAYTEVNQVTVGKLPRTDLVIAKRIGDCREDSAALSGPPDLTIEQ
jgi:hypothetical protein